MKVKQKNLSSNQYGNFRKELSLCFFLSGVDYAQGALPAFFIR